MTFKCYKFNVDNAYTLHHIPYTQQGNKNDSDVTSPRRVNGWEEAQKNKETH